MLQQIYETFLSYCEWFQLVESYFLQALTPFLDALRKFHKNLLGRNTLLLISVIQLYFYLVLALLLTNTRFEDHLVFLMLNFSKLSSNFLKNQFILEKTNFLQHSVVCNGDKKKTCIDMENMDHTIRKRVGGSMEDIGQHWILEN